VGSGQSFPISILSNVIGYRSWYGLSYRVCGVKRLPTEAVMLIWSRALQRISEHGRAQVVRRCRFCYSEQGAWPNTCLRTTLVGGCVISHVLSTSRLRSERAVNSAALPTMSSDNDDSVRKAIAGDEVGCTSAVESINMNRIVDVK